MCTNCLIIASCDFSSSCFLFLIFEENSNLNIKYALSYIFVCYVVCGQSVVSDSLQPHEL